MTTEAAKILITDDHRMFAEGLRAMLMIRKKLGEPDIAESAEEALGMLARQEYNLLITDINMPGISGIELTRQVKQEHPGVKVLVITMHDDHEIINEILNAEAEGYILKNSSPDDFFKAIEKILVNQTFYSNDVMSVLLTRMKKNQDLETNLARLTDRETEIIRLIASDCSSEEIAEKLFISIHTVNTHRKNILRKAALSKTSQL
ncbi:MAG: response regulator, partial [Bacteroidota bacterium]